MTGERIAGTCTLCAREATAMGLVRIGKTTAAWQPLCREHAETDAQRIKALPMHEQSHAEEIRARKRATKELLASAVLPGGETWGVKDAVNLGYSSDAKAMLTNAAPGTGNAGWGVQPAPQTRGDDAGEHRAPKEKQ